MDYFLDSRYTDAETGLEIIRQIRSQKPATNIIVLSAQEDVNIIVDAVKEFHCDYVKKDEHAFEKIADIITKLNVS